MKKFVVSFMCMAVLLVSSVCYANELLFINDDGGIYFKGSDFNIDEASVITITATKKSADWLDRKVWEDDSDFEKIVYYGTVTAEKGGNFDVQFAAKNPGAFLIYVNAEGLEEPFVYEATYINETKNKEALELLLDAKSSDDIVDILKNKKDDLGLFDKIYTEANLDNVAKIVYNELLENTKLDTEGAIAFIYKAMLMDMLECDKISDIDDYTKYLHLEDIDAEDIYNADLSSYMTEGLSGKDFDDLEEFDESIRENLMLAVIDNNDGIGTIAKVMKLFYEDLGLKKAEEVTTKLVSKVAEEGNFNSIENLKEFVLDNTKKNTTSAGGGGGSSSGRPSNKSESTNYGTAISYIDTKKEETKTYVFSDIESVLWANEAIEALYLAGIINGKTENEFVPNDFVKREEFVKMLTGAFKMNLIDDEFVFTDVSKEHWSYAYVKTAYLAGITNGISETEFGLGKNITRQDACVMIKKALEVSGYEISGSKSIEFTDSEEISEYAKDSVKILTESSIVNGYSDGSFKPQASITRAEAAKLIYSVMGCIK